MRKHGRVDDNQPEIVAAYRAAGCSVLILSSVGDGCPDILVGWGKLTDLAEIKDGSKMPSDRALTPLEAEFIESWSGSPVKIIESVDDVTAHLKDMSQRRWV